MVAIDAGKSVVAAAIGHGKLSSRRVKEGLSGHVAPGSLVIHDREKAHNALTRESGCEGGAHRADVRDPVCLERMQMVNSLCSWLKRYLWRFAGMDPANLQSYLNWFVYLFRVKRDEETWPKTERVVRRLMMHDLGNRRSGTP